MEEAKEAAHEAEHEENIEVCEADVVLDEGNAKQVRVRGEEEVKFRDGARAEQGLKVLVNLEARGPDQQISDLLLNAERKVLPDAEHPPQGYGQPPQGNMHPSQEYWPPAPGYGNPPPGQGSVYPPQQLSMVEIPLASAVTGAPVTANSMLQHDAITMQQTTRGCVQECFGCEAKTEYR